MKTDEVIACNCTGIRSCLVCNKSPANVSYGDNDPPSQSYWFCPSCAKLFEGCVIIPRNHNQEGQNDWCALHISSTPSQRFVDGIHCVQSFLTAEEERLLVNGIDEGAWKLSQSGRRKQVLINFDLLSHISKFREQGKPSGLNLQVKLIVFKIYRLS